MAAAISITNLTKTYATGQHALKGVSLEIRPGEIFALLGPNGAGKTTLISIVCGIVRATSGTVLVDGHDIQRDFRAARERIGLVPQELAIEAFETVRAAAAFSRGLFGRPPDPARVERVLRDLSLWDRRDDILMTLSGGMKRRVMIAKALAHEPRILFLDEPTAGVDVELRRDLWDLVRRLRDQGVTIILTTHYIDEAEELADRIGVVNHGELVVVDDKKALMRKLGKRQLTLTLQAAARRGARGARRLETRAQRRRPRAAVHLRRRARADRRRAAAQAARAARHRLARPQHARDLAGGDLRQPRRAGSARVSGPAFNRHGVWAIYRFEMARFLRTLLQSVLTPVITTSLFVIVFGAAIGSRMAEVDGVSYGAFIVPGLIMLSLFTESISNASFGIHFPKFTGTIFEILSAPVAAFEIVLGYVGAAATKSVLLGLIILATAAFFVPLTILHPAWMIAFMLLTAVTFSLFGFIVGIWAKNWEQMQLVPMLIVTPLTFLGGAFYSIDMLPPGWRTVALFNPVLYLISGFRWSFFGRSDVSVGLSLGMTLVFMLACLGVIAWIFRTGYRLKN